MTELRRIRTRKQNYILAITAHSQLQLAQKTTIRLPFSRFRTISHALLPPNAVGYENLDWMAADYYMMGAQFENTSGGDLHLEDIDFGDLAATAPYFDYEDNFKKTAVQVQIANADKEGSLTYYFLADGNYDEQSGIGTPGWVDAGGVYANPTVPMGRGCWFRPLPTGEGLTVNFYINGKPKAE